MAIDWSLLRDNAPVDIAGNFARGYKMADEIVSKISERNALGYLAQNPDDPAALARLYQVNPGQAAVMEKMNMARHEAARQSDARNALAGLVGPIGQGQFGDFKPNAITGQMPEPIIDAPVARDSGTAIVASAANRQPGTNIDAPSKVGDIETPPEAAPSPGGDPITITAKRAAPEAVRPDLSDQWREYVAADPEGGMKLLINRHDLNKKQATDLAAQMDIIGRLAGSATDPESYSKALRYGQALGFDTSNIPQEYSPEAVNQIQTQAMSAKEAVKLKWDIKDDQIDNARADRAMQLQHQDRQRGQDISSRDRRRGQDMADDRSRDATATASQDRRRGQDLAHQDRRPAASGGGARPTIIVNPKTGQRMKLEGGKWVPA